MNDSSYVEVWNTSPLRVNVGGLWDLYLYGESGLQFHGGELNYLGLSRASTAVLDGGYIGCMGAAQEVSIIGRDPVTQEPIYNRHIEMIVKDYEYDDLTGLLTGTWVDDTLFRIQLIDVPGYTPTFENISFTIIPEPVTFVLLAFGAAGLRTSRQRAPSSIRSA